MFDAVGLNRLTCPCYHALKRGYTEAQPPNDVPAPLPATPVQSAKILTMKPAGDTTCMLCGSTFRLPHKSVSECMAALDAEIHSLFARMKLLRKSRAELIARRLAVYRSFLKNSGHLA